MPIDKSKIMVVYNLDESVSSQVADAYISARGLNPTHKYGMNLGVAVGGVIPSYGTYIGGQTAYDSLTPLANYMIANGIQAIICSALCPEGILIQSPHSYLGIYQDSLSLENVFGCAKFWKNVVYGFLSSTTVKNANTTETMRASFSSSSNTVRCIDKTSFAKFTTDLLIPFGRLGTPKITNRGGTYVDETLAGTMSYVTDPVRGSLVNEQSILSAKNLPIHFHYYDKILNFSISIEQARLEAVRNGLTCYIMRFANYGWPCNADLYGVPPDTYTMASMGVTPAPPLWGKVGLEYLHDLVPSDQLYQAILPGAWAVSGMSYGLTDETAEYLQKGAVAASGCTYEPGADAILNNQAFMTCLLQGMSMMEAAHYSGMQGGWMASTWGDPLYAPFGKQNVTLVG